MEENKINKNDWIILEQYQCNSCGRFHYIQDLDKSDLDLEGYTCPYCKELTRHVRTLNVQVKEIALV